MVSIKSECPPITCNINSYRTLCCKLVSLSPATCHIRLPSSSPLPLQPSCPSSYICPRPPFKSFCSSSYFLSQERASFFAPRASLIASSASFLAPISRAFCLRINTKAPSNATPNGAPTPNPTAAGLLDDDGEAWHVLGLEEATTVVGGAIVDVTVIVDM